MSKKELKNYLPEIKEALQSDDDSIVRLFYEIDDKTIIGATELSWIIDTCLMNYINPMPFLLGERDTDLLIMLKTKAEIDYQVDNLPNAKPEKKSKRKDESGKVVEFNFGKNKNKEK